MVISTAYTIQMASKISGVGVHTIRAWEKRYKALVPSRDSSGHRVYSKEDIEKLMLLSELCLLGYSISKVANHPINELKKLLIDLGKSEESLSGPSFSLVEEKSSVDFDQSLAILKFALMNVNLDVISQELQKLKTALSPREYAEKLLVPFMLTVEKSAQESRMTSAQRESLHSLMSFHWSTFLFSAGKKESGKNPILIASFDRSHEWECAGAGMLCDEANIGYLYNGTLSAEALLELVKSLQIKCLILAGSSHDQVAVSEKIQKTIKSELSFLFLNLKGTTFNMTSSKHISVARSLDDIQAFLQRH